MVSTGAPDFLWSKHIGQIGGTDFGESIVVDNSGNIYLSGEFQSAVIDLGGIFLTNRGASDVFLAKYERGGNLVWAKQIGGSKWDRAARLALGPGGDIYITASFLSSEISLGSTVFTNNGMWDFFVARLDGDGEPIWITQGIGADSDQIDAIAVDAAGNCFVAGYSDGPTVNYGGTILTNRGSLDQSTTSKMDTFFAKYSPDGLLEWVQQFGSYTYPPYLGIAADAGGNCYLAGSFLGKGTFGSTNLQALASLDIFVAKYAPDGAVQWARRAGGLGTDADYAKNGNYVRCLKLDREGNLYMAGTFHSPVVEFDSFSLTNAGRQNAYLAKLAPDNSVLWATGIYSSSKVITVCIDIDSKGNCYSASTFSSPTLQLGDYVMTNSSSDWHNDMFLSKYDPDGNLNYLRQTKGDLDENANAIWTDIAGNCYITGAFSSNDLQLGNTNYNAGGSFNIFVAKLDTTIQPSLAYDRKGDAMFLSWSQLFGGYELQMSGNASGSNWAPFKGNIAQANGTNAAEIPIDLPPALFRLARP